MLRLHLAERWEPKDYIQAISAIETLYYVMAFRHDLADSPWLFEPVDYRFTKYPRRSRSRDGLNSLAENFVEQSRLLADHEHRLFVEKISHASPGFIDFEGLGDVIRAVKEMVEDSVGFFANRRRRHAENDQAELKTEKRRLDVESTKVELARQKLKLLDELQDRHDRYRHPEARRQIERVLVSELSKIEDMVATGLLTDQRDHKYD